MTHGPPRLEGEDDYALDTNENEVHCGCENSPTRYKGEAEDALLWHIHEGRGAMRMDWNDGKMSGVVATEKTDGSLLRCEKKGQETLLVNAARFGNTKGWLVDFEV
jgi:hypothetical protein